MWESKKKWGIKREVGNQKGSRESKKKLGEVGP
jgi:hypothetical protein